MKHYRVRQLVNHDETIPNAFISVAGGVITEMNSSDQTRSAETYEYAIPGFVDIHLHGYHGYGVMDNSVESLSGMATALLEKGTTTFCATTVTASLAELRRVLTTGRAFLEHNRSAAAEGREAYCPGFHLEGPWISAEKTGAQNEQFIAAPGPGSLELVSSFNDILEIVTLSYDEQKTAMVEHLVKCGIIAAAGHDDTPDYLALEGFTKGISHVTHIYCLSSSFQRRNGRKHLGTLEMALITDGVTVEVIADNHHITRYFWEFIRHNKKREDIVVASDAIPVAGLHLQGGREFSLAGVDIVVEDGVAWTADRSVYAGSVSCMHDMFLVMVEQWGVTMEDAVRFCAHNPARLLGMDCSIGRISPRATADILFLHEDLSLAKIIKSAVEITPLPGANP